MDYLKMMNYKIQTL